MKTCETCGALANEKCHTFGGDVLSEPHLVRTGWQDLYDEKYRDRTLRFRLGGNG